MKTQKDIELDIVKWRSIRNGAEPIATFGTLILLQVLFGTFLISAIGAVAAYLIVNGVVLVNISGLKEKWQNLKNRF